MNWYLKVLKEYANFKGRARRTEYWMFTLFNILVSIALGVVLSLTGLPPALILLYSLAVFLPSMAVAVRRLHDTNRSGWFMLLAFVPLVSLYLLYLMVVDSDPNNNSYGPNPKGV
jgi:uncharacterized membrane protein YhaH (DUF805 family)